MFRKCVINTCNTIKAGDGITLHYFPDNPNIQQSWLKAILRETGQTKFNQDDVVCSKHFSTGAFHEERDADNEICLVLNPNAIPFASKVDNSDDMTGSGSSSSSKKPRIEDDSVARCCWYDCTNNSKDNPRLEFYPFPADPAVRSKWDACCEGRDMANKHICSHHFAEEYFVENPTTGDHILRLDAVPMSLKKENEMDISEDNSLFTIVEVEPSAEEVVTYPTAQASHQVINTESQSSSASDDFISPCFNERRKCAIKKCPSAIVSSGIETYPLPREKSKRKIWINSIAASTCQMDFTSNSSICLFHFDGNSFQLDTNGKKRLAGNAVPTIFKESNNIPSIDLDNYDNDELAEFHEWSLQRNQEYIRLKNIMNIQAKRMARLAKSIDDFKAKRFVSDEANTALQNLFDKVLDAQYPIL